MIRQLSEAVPKARVMMFRIRPAVLAPLVIIPAVTMLVLIVDGTAFESGSPVLPSDPCPASAASERGTYPTTYTEDARPYTGPGPHTVDLRFQLAHTPLPSHWKAPENEPYTAELVVCEYVEETGITDIKCAYRGYGQVWLVQARATYLVLEAKSSNLVASFKVKGRDSCPASFSYSPDEPRLTDVRADMDADAVIEKLRPYVEGKARQPGPTAAGAGSVDE
ncbi:hypothetical protein ACIP2X_09115 [Streptomyces sp. NPDC089424]|uniref:hypothetical protein n=1 Tax=Streptomyces sp. NPDC089424 TaxID=3365917 RepID=UPI0037F9140F